MSVRNAATYGLAALAVLLLLFALDLVLLFFLAIILAVMFSALANALARRTGLGRSWSLAAVLALIAVGLTSLFWIAGPAIIDQLVEMQVMLPEALNRIQQLMTHFVWLETLMNALPTGEALERPGVGGRLFSGAFTIVINVFIVLIVGVYLAATPCVYVDGFVRIFPPRHRPRAYEVLDTMYATLKGWLLGMLIAMTLVGTLMFVGLWLIGVPLAGALGVIAGLFEFIPYVGPWLGGSFAVLMSLSVGTHLFFYVIGLVLLIQMAEAYLITPLVMRRVIHLPPALTLVALVTGSLAAGWLGLLLATPALAMIVVVVRMVYIESILGDTSEPAAAEAAARGSAKDSAARDSASRESTAKGASAGKASSGKAAAASKA